MTRRTLHRPKSLSCLRKSRLCEPEDRMSVVRPLVTRLAGLCADLSSPQIDRRQLEPDSVARDGLKLLPYRPGCRQMAGFAVELAMTAHERPRHTEGIESRK